MDSVQQLTNKSIKPHPEEKANNSYSGTVKEDSVKILLFDALA